MKNGKFSSLSILDNWQSSFALGSKTSAFFLLCILLASCQASPAPQGQAAIVQRVVSGQTLEVTGLGSQPTFIESVRLAGISAPDLQQQPWGAAARKELKTLLGSQASVLIEKERAEKDRYDRYLAYVWQNGTLLNETLVRRGYALARGDYNPRYRDRLLQAQDYARVMGYGIWDPENPLRQTPEEFRNNNR